MGDRVEAISPRYVTSHPDQLSLLPSAGREMNTGQSAVMLCGCGVKTGWLLLVDKRAGSRKNCDPSFYSWR